MTANTPANETRDLSVDVAACRRRQQRLTDQMQQAGVTQVLLSRSESLQWLTGAYVGPLFHPTASMDLEGHVTLVLPSRKAEIACAADKVLCYEEKWLSTMRDACDQRAASLQVLLGGLSQLGGKVGCEFTAAGLGLDQQTGVEWVDFDQVMFSLRRCKDADELRMLAFANRANEAMYAHAREAIKPGINELDLYNQLQAVAVETLGEPNTYFGQDFRAAARGGAPRNRQAESGELYILDLGVGFRGYYSDNARTIAVNGEPTEKQQQAWEMIAPVFPHVEATVKPGVSCKLLFEQVQEMLKPAEPWLFNHHLGHGVGLAPHEGPHLNPNWDDTFTVGDHFAVEPGLYHDDLRLGIRLEQNYVVTESGVELLTDWPLQL